MDKHIPNEKELIRPRRLCLRRELPEPGAHNFACGANYHIPVWFNYACGANYHTPGWFNYACGANYHIPGWFNYACGANYPYQALKGGLFLIQGSNNRKAKKENTNQTQLSKSPRLFNLHSLERRSPKHYPFQSTRVQQCELFYLSGEY